MKNLAKIIGLIFLWFAGSVLHLWSALVLYYCSFFLYSALRSFAVAGYISAIIIIVVLSKKKYAGLLISLLGFVAVARGFGSIQPKANAQYPPELTLPDAEFRGDNVTIYNVRNCSYRSPNDFDVRYETRTYDLNDLKTLDVMVNYWGMDLIAHTFLSFGFSDGRYIAVSVEIRPEIGKAYDMLQGFFKQYNLIYIWADERDLVRLRTNYKKEDVYLYRTTLSPENVRKMFVSMLETTHAMAGKPQFYNTATNSCTNTLGNHLIAAKIAKIPFWKRRFLTGDVDRRMYNDGLLDRSVPFPELRREANIDDRAQKADQDSDFSEKIRTHLK
jgi:hypothetical protein